MARVRDARDGRDNDAAFGRRMVGRACSRAHRATLRPGDAALGYAELPPLRTDLFRKPPAAGSSACFDPSDTSERSSRHGEERVRDLVHARHCAGSGGGDGGRLHHGEAEAHGAEIVVAREEHVQSCKRLGQTTVRTAEMVAGVPRGAEVVNAELERLARNAAVEADADTIVAADKPWWGEQKFNMYRCRRDALNRAWKVLHRLVGRPPGREGYLKISAKKSFMRAHDRASAWASYFRFAMPPCRRRGS